MKCSNCGAGNGANDKYCAFCGTKIETDSVIPREHSEEGSSTNAWNETRPSKKNRGPAIAVFTVLVLFLGLLTVFGYQYYIANQMTPEERLTHALIQALEAEGGLISSTLTFEVLEGGSVGSEPSILMDLIQNLELVSLVTYDVDGMQAEADLNLQMMGNSWMTYYVYIDKEQVMFDVPLIYYKPLYIHWHDLMAMVGSATDRDELAEASSDTSVLQDLADIVIGVFDKDQYDTFSKIDPSVYKALMAGYFVEVIHRIDQVSFQVDDEDIEGTIYHMVYDEQETHYLIEDVLEEMSEDRKVMDFLEEVVTLFMDRIVENKNYILYATVMEMDIGSISTWETHFASDLEAKKTELIDQIREGLGNANYDMQGAVDEARNQVGLDLDSVVGDRQMTLDFKLDKEDVLRAQEVFVTIDMSEFDEEAQQVVMSLVNEYHEMDGDITFKGHDLVSGVDVGKLSDQELMTLIDDIQNNVFNKLINNPSLSDLFMMDY